MAWLEEEAASKGRTEARNDKGGSGAVQDWGGDKAGSTTAEDCPGAKECLGKARRQLGWGEGRG